MAARPPWAVALLLAAWWLAVVESTCPNLCSGHGSCGAGDVCTCYTTYNASTDCSMRHCPYGLVWADKAIKANTAHSWSECSSHGTCDRAAGECVCDLGWTGSGCARSKMVFSTPCIKEDARAHTSTVPRSRSWRDSPGPSSASLTSIDGHPRQNLSLSLSLSPQDPPSTVPIQYVCKLVSCLLTPVLVTHTHTRPPPPPHTHTFFPLDPTDTAKCNSDCNGHGRCESMYRAGKREGIDTVPGTGGDGVGPLYTNWEANAAYMCVCDWGYTGPSCKNRE
jgi:hypothetical protein